MSDQTESECEVWADVPADFAGYDDPANWTERAVIAVADQERGESYATGYRMARDKYRAEWQAAQEKLRAVEALADEWEHEDRTNGPTGDRVEELRAALRGES